MRRRVEEYIWRIDGWRSADPAGITVLVACSLELWWSTQIAFQFPLTISGLFIVCVWFWWNILHLVLVAGFHVSFILTLYFSILSSIRLRLWCFMSKYTIWLDLGFLYIFYKQIQITRILSSHAQSGLKLMLPSTFHKFLFRIKYFENVYPSSQLVMQDVKIKMFWLLELLVSVWLHLSQYKFLDKVFYLTRIVLAKAHLKKFITLLRWFKEIFSLWLIIRLWKEYRLGGKCRNKIKEWRLTKKTQN